jgi:hypothetical protein
MGKNNKKYTLRGILVNTIIENAPDEMENYDDYIRLAMESEEDLVYRLIRILEYYRSQISI